MLPRRLDRSRVTMGVTVEVTHNGTRTEGGCTKNRGGCTTPPFIVSPSLFVFVVLSRRSRTAPAERDKTGATPHFLPLARHGEGGVWHQVYHLVYHTPTAVGGVAPVLNYPCGKADAPAQARDWTRQRAARCVTGFSARFSAPAASVPWPRGRGRACAPRPIPALVWCAMTRRICPQLSSSGTTSRRTWPRDSSADVLSARPGSGAPGWASGWGSARAFLRWPLSPTFDRPALVIGEGYHPSH